MISDCWIILTLVFLFACSNGYSKEVYGFQEKNNFNNKIILLDYQPIKNNSLVYAACDIELSCTIVLEHFPTAKEVRKKACEINYQANATKIINEDQFQLKLLYDDRVIIMWSDQDQSTGKNFSIFRTIDMSSCNSIETTFTHDFVPHLLANIDDYYVVPYVNTFDLFFYSDNLCSDKMCGQTYDADGILINGPVASYLPAKFFRKPVFVYSADPGSSSMGYFLLSSKLYLVSSYYGRVKKLMDYPSGVDVLAFSCDNGYLGFCWLSRYNERQINCTQFNAKGEKTMSMIVELEYRPGMWMDIYNLPEGGILMLTSQCNDDIWCIQNVDSVAFYAMELHKGGQVEEVHEIRGVDCNYVQDIKTDIVRKDNGDVCMTFACHVGQDDTGELYVNLLSKCITNR